MGLIAVVGGHGKVALRLHPLLVQAGHVPVALVRSEGHRAELKALGAVVRMLDIEAGEEDAFAAAIEGCDAVVFSAGGGADGNVERKRTVDLEGSLKSMRAAGRLGIRRFVQVSAIGADNPVPDDAPEAWKAYVAAKRDADIALRGTGLDWTILRPGRLTDDPGTDRVALAPELPRGEVTRADVAAVVAAVLDEERTIGAQWELVAGDLTVDQAITQAARS